MNAPLATGITDLGGSFKFDLEGDYITIGKDHMVDIYKKGDVAIVSTTNDPENRIGYGQIKIDVNTTYDGFPANTLDELITLLT